MVYVYCVVGVICYHGSRRTNYSCEVLNMLHQQITLPPRLSAQLLWSRFINVHGLPGRNIAGDLYMEHLNRVGKEAVGANKTDKAIERVGKALGTIAPNVDEENGVAAVSGAHHRAKDRNIIIAELLKVDAFVVHVGRNHPTFQSPKDLLHAKTNTEITVYRLKK